jgi:predicted small metal-binding protein
VCSSEDEILAEVAGHAAADHGMSQVPPEVVAQVRAHITTVAGDH